MAPGDSARLQLQVSGRRRAFSRLKAQWFSSSCRCCRDMYAGVGTPWRRGVESGFVMRRHAPLSRLWMLCLPSRAASKTPRPRHGRKGKPKYGACMGHEAVSVSHPATQPSGRWACTSESRQTGSRRSFLERCYSLTGWIMPAWRLPVYPFAVTLLYTQNMHRMLHTPYPRIDSSLKQPINYRMVPWFPKKANSILII